ncbi:zinc finger protein OZF-like [Contarinia nasturtii]|uniref:zinc finger protein OZF-like n=1 Tax=Contarinia nasturtii TaxID=265458 RepID=UPI0012D4351D|nr:zinc finger protein OZF-like [Contarinia nasturtii]
MTENWQRTLANYWTNSRIITEATLRLLRDELRCIGMPFDDNFKEYFLRVTNYGIAETCDKFLNDVRLEEQFIEFLSTNQESINKKMATDASSGTVINVPNNYHHPATDTNAPIINQMVNSVANWYTLPSSTPYHGMVSNVAFQPFTSNLDNNRINSEKKRKIAPRSTLKTILSESPSIDLRSEESRSAKQSKSVGAQRSQRIKTNSNSAEQQKGSTSNGKSKTKCEFCNYVARFQSQLIIHTRIHTGEKPFECNICTKGFIQKSSLNMHIRIHAKQFPFHCSICRQGFTVKQAKETHVKNCNPRRYECYLCKYYTLRKSSLVTHMCIHTGEFHFQCNICAKRFIQKQHLKSHMRTHANQFPFHCSICRQGFTVKWEKEIHEKNCNPRRFECYLCKYATPLKSNLVRHMRIHTGYKPFRCSHCSERFNVKSNLNSHQKLHHNKSK